MRNDAPRPGPRRLGRAGIAVIAILVVLVLVIFVGRNLWHASEVDDATPRMDQAQRP